MMLISFPHFGKLILLNWSLKPAVTRSPVNERNDILFVFAGRIHIRSLVSANVLANDAGGSCTEVGIPYLYFVWILLYLLDAFQLHCENACV